MKLYKRTVKPILEGYDEDDKNKNPLESVPDDAVVTVGKPIDEILSTAPFVVVNIVGIKKDEAVIKINMSKHPADNVLVQIEDRLYKLIETVNE